MKVGEVAIPTDEDFQEFKTECVSDEGWTICYDKSTCRVSTKINSLSAFGVVRVRKKKRKRSNILSSQSMIMFRFNRNLISQLNCSMMFFMMDNIDQLGIQQ